MLNSSHCPPSYPPTHPRPTVWRQVDSNYSFQQFKPLSKIFSFWIQRKDSSKNTSTVNCSSCSSLTTIPSVARLRYATKNESCSSGETECYNYLVCRGFLQMQRIIVEHPGTVSPSVSYYCEAILAQFHCLSLGARYTRLFLSNNKGLSVQERRQWASSIPWSCYYIHAHQSRYHYSPSLRTSCIELLFRPKRKRRVPLPIITLTDDFCAWTRTDQLGTGNLLVSPLHRPSHSMEIWRFLLRP